MPGATKVPTAGRVARLSLVRPTVCLETVVELERLLAQARRGEIIGLAAVAPMRGGIEYSLHTTGETERNATFALGMVRVLADDLSARIRGV